MTAGAREAGRYRAGTARPTNGVVARIGVVAVVVAGIPLMDADPLRLVFQRVKVAACLIFLGRVRSFRPVSCSRVARCSAHGTRGIDARNCRFPAATRHVRVALGLSGRDNRTTAKQRRYRIKPDLRRKACNGREYLNS